MPRPQTLPLDPNSAAGLAAAEALTDFLASVELRLARRRRQATTAAAATQKAA